jgi:predicted DNA-binding WGR domain protein
MAAARVDVRAANRLIARYDAGYMRIYLQKPAEGSSPPKFYQVLVQQDLIEGWILLREWGNQGSGGRVKREHFATREEAEQALEEAREAQVKRGYQVVFVQGTYR